MKTISQILLEASGDEKTELYKIIDKTSPSGVLEKRLDMLKKETPSALISLIYANQVIKATLLSEVMVVEDLVATGIYNLKYGNVKCKDILKMRDFFPKDPNTKAIEKFDKILSEKKINKIDLYNVTLFEAFNSFTLGGKINLIKLMDRDVVKNIIKSKSKKFNKKELLNSLEHSRMLRNHVAHNFFILNKGPYLKMVDKRISISKNFSELEIMKYLFDQLGKLLRITGFTPISSKVKSEIKKHKNIKKNELNIILLEI